MIFLDENGVDVIRQLLFDFGKQTYDELRQLLPHLTDKYFEKSLEILVSKYEITLSEIENQKWYEINSNNRMLYNSDKKTGTQQL
jgi:hypothetical protein